MVVSLARLRIAIVCQMWLSSSCLWCLFSDAFVPSDTRNNFVNGRRLSKQTVSLNVVFNDDDEYDAPQTTKSEVLMSNRKDFFRQTAVGIASATTNGALSSSFANPASAAGGKKVSSIETSSILLSPLSPSAPVQIGSTSSAASTALISSSTSNKIKLPPLGLGAWAWGDTLFWGYDKQKDNELREVFDYALDNNLAFFDTAELYGLGRSESLLGQFRKESSTTNAEKVSIATKFAPFPWRTKREDVVKACKASVERLGGKPIDIYQIHFPNAWSNANYWDGLADCYDAGLVRAVGVSNYGKDALRATHDALAKRGIPLATNQIQLSLLYRWPLQNGLLDTCKELGVEVLSYSPLCLGLLTGKYSKDTLPSGPRAKLGEKLFNDPGYDKLLATMKDIASSHDCATPSQVALNWAIAKSTCPIPGARNLKQIQQNVACLKWKMSEAEVSALDGAAALVEPLLPPDKAPFPKVDINTGLIMFDS